MTISKEPATAKVAFKLIGLLSKLYLAYRAVRYGMKEFDKYKDGEDNIFLCHLTIHTLNSQLTFQTSEQIEINFHHSHHKYTFFQSFII